MTLTLEMVFDNFVEEDALRLLKAMVLSARAGWECPGSCACRGPGQDGEANRL